jgi:hypothetical protein
MKLFASCYSDVLTHGLAPCVMLYRVRQQVRDTQCIETLDLGNMGANDTFIIELASALEVNTSVTTLNLDTNDVRETGFNALATMLETNRTIRKLTAANQRHLVPTKV